MSGFCSSQFSSLHISLWRGETDEHDVGRLHEEVRELLNDHDSVSLLLIVDASAPLVGDPARKRAVEMLRELGARITSIAIVTEGTGFWAGAVRSMFVGLAMILRPPFAWRMFSTLGPATTWQRPYLGSRNRASDPDIIGELVEELRRCDDVSSALGGAA